MATWSRWDFCSTVDLQEIERLVESTSAADVLTKVCRMQFLKVKGSVMSSMSVVTANRSEMKHYGGEQHHKGGGDHSGSVYFIHLLAGPVISVLVGRSSLAGPAQREERFTRQDVISENEGIKRKRKIWIKTYSQRSVIMINGCVFQQSPMMKKVWLWDAEWMTFCFESINMKCLGSQQLLWFVPK